MTEMIAAIIKASTSWAISHFENSADLIHSACQCIAPGFLCHQMSSGEAIILSFLATAVTTATGGGRLSGMSAWRCVSRVSAAVIVIGASIWVGIVVRAITVCQ